MSTQTLLLQRYVVVRVHVNAWCRRSAVSGTFPKLQSAGHAWARAQHCARLICCCACVQTDTTCTHALLLATWIIGQS